MHRTMTMGAKAPPDPIDLCSLLSERREQRGEEAPVKLPRKARRFTRTPGRPRRQGGTGRGGPRVELTPAERG